MEFIIILLLLILNGIFAMYELALVSASKARLETMVGKGNKRAKGVLKQLEEPEKFLSTIQIGITLIGIVSGAYGGATLSDEVEPLFLLIPGAEPYAHTLAVATVVVVITSRSLIVGELVPKSIALRDPEKWATRLSPLMIAVKNISYPFVLLLSASTKLVNKLIGLEEGAERQMTQEELKMILHQSSEQGVIDKDETEMLRDVFRFSDKRANDLMTYRRDIVVMHPTDTREDVLQRVNYAGTTAGTGSPVRPCSSPKASMPRRCWSCSRRTRTSSASWWTNTAAPRASSPCTTSRRASSVTSSRRTKSRRRTSWPDKTAPCWWKAQ